VMGKIARRGSEGLAARDPQPRCAYPKDAKRLMTSGRSLGDIEGMSMSMTGFAANPGTAVLPTCSIAAARPPSTAAIDERSVWKRWGQSRS
jgi:hypothetical protein